MIEVTCEKVPASLGTSMPVKIVLVSVSVPHEKSPVSDHKSLDVKAVSQSVNPEPKYLDALA